MAEDKDIQNTLKGTEIGGGRDDMADGSYSDGYYDAGPEGNFEGSLGNDMTYEFNDGKMTETKAGTRHPGQIEADGYHKMHGDMDEYGFVRRPRGRGDVERN